MPRGDGSGPAGMGPMTGRGAGYCAGYATPGYMNPMPGRGWGMGWGRGGGRGWGRGRGWRNLGYPGVPPVYGDTPYYAPPTREQELGALKAQAEQFESTLTGIKQRIAELEAAQQKED